jgi:hypothetical protein
MAEHGRAWQSMAEHGRAWHAMKSFAYYQPKEFFANNFVEMFRANNKYGNKYSRNRLFF